MRATIAKHLTARNGVGEEGRRERERESERQRGRETEKGML